MLLNHVALVSSSEENSDLFFRDLLGLKKMGPKTVPSELARKLFGLNEEYRVIDYGNEKFKFEVFLARPGLPDNKRLDHVCLEVRDRPALLSKAADLGLEIIQAPKGEALVVFLKDFDGNLYEIKDKI